MHNPGQPARPAPRPCAQRPGRARPLPARSWAAHALHLRPPAARPAACLPPAPRARARLAPARPCRPRLLPATCASPRACLRAPACCHAQPSALFYCDTVCVLQYNSFLFKQQQSRYNVCIVTQPASPAKPACNTILFIAIYF